MQDTRSVLSLTEALSVIRSEFDGAWQLSDDVGTAHQLGKHVAILHEFRTHVHIPLWSRSTARAAAASPG